MSIFGNLWLYSQVFFCQQTLYMLQHYAAWSTDLLNQTPSKICLYLCCLTFVSNRNSMSVAVRWESRRVWLIMKRRIHFLCNALRALAVTLEYLCPCIINLGVIKLREWLSPHKQEAPSRYHLSNIGKAITKICVPALQQSYIRSFMASLC